MLSEDTAEQLALIDRAARTDAAGIARKVLEHHGIDPDHVTVADLDGNERLISAAQLCGAIVMPEKTVAELVAEAQADSLLWCELSEATHCQCRRRGALTACAFFQADDMVTPEEAAFVKRLVAALGDPVLAARRLGFSSLEATEAELLAGTAGPCSDDEKAWIVECAGQFAAFVTDEERAAAAAFFHDGQRFTMKRLYAAEAALREGIVGVEAFGPGSGLRQ